jgi:hypothetical protein
MEMPMRGLTLAALAAALTLAGCQDGGGIGIGGEDYRSQTYPSADRPLVFETARTVLGMYFSIASADPDTGKIVSRPLQVEASRDRLLGSTPTQKIATMRIYRTSDGQTAVDLRIIVQKQDAMAFAAMQPITEGNEVPNQTPAQTGAAQTPEQRQSWQDVGRDYTMEQTILADLGQKLNLNLSASQPAPQP